MKILHLDTRPDWRGGQLQILLTLRGLRERGHDAQLLARRDSPLAGRATAENFRVHFFSPRLARLQAALCLREILDQQNFDIVHAHDPHALTAAWLARAHHRTPIVASRRVALPLGRSRIALARYRVAQRILAVSQFVAKTLERSGVEQKKVAVVYDGVEIPSETTAEGRRAARARWKISDDDYLLGSASYLVAGKGQEIAIRALAQLRKSKAIFRLVIAGDGPARQNLEQLAGRLGVREAVILAGFLDDISEFYRALDVFAFPARGEALGTSLLLAMAHGLPAVAAASGGVPEIMESGRTGFLVASDAAENLRDAVQAGIGGDAELAEQRASEFAAAIEKLRNDPAAAARMGIAARELVQERFSAAALAERTLAEYEKVLTAAKNR